MSDASSGGPLPGYMGVEPFIGWLPIHQQQQRWDNMWPHGYNLNKKEKYLPDNPTQNIKAISLVVSDKKIFKVFENLFLPM